MMFLRKWLENEGRSTQQLAGYGNNVDDPTVEMH